MSQAYGPTGRTYAGPPARPAIPPLVRPRGARAVLFAVLVSVALVLGALVMGFVLVAGGEPAAIGVGIVLATLPVGPLVAAYFWLDRHEPEPRRLLVLAFAWGALVATGAALVLQVVEQVAAGSNEEFSAVVMAPFTEEAAKGAFVLLMLWLRRQVLDGLVDALVYAGLVGVGFAFTENILYYSGAYTGGTDLGPGGLASATGLFVLRGVFSPFAHPLFTSATAVGVAIAVTSRRRVVRLTAPFIGYLAAVVMHAWWNGSSFIGNGRYFLLTYLFAMLPGFLAMLALALWARARERRLLVGAMHDLTRYGYLSQAELPWLTTLKARRTARRRASAQGGPEAGRLVQEYQQQAVQLAALHHRVLRGTAPPGSHERASLMLQRLTALRVATGWLRSA